MSYVEVDALKRAVMVEMGKGLRKCSFIFCDSCFDRGPAREMVRSLMYQLPT